MSVSTTLLSDLDSKAPAPAQPPTNQMSLQDQQQLMQMQQQQQMQQMQQMKKAQNQQQQQMQQNQPQYVLYVLPNSEGCTKAIKYYQMLHRHIRLININDLPKDKIPKWLKGAPTLIDLAVHRMFVGTLAIDHLYHLAKSGVLTKGPAIDPSNMKQDGKQNPVGPKQPLPGTQLMNRPPPGSVSRSDRMEKPIGPPPATLAPATSDLGLQNAMKEKMMEEQMDPMPPPSVDPNGGSGGGGRRGSQQQQMQQQMQQQSQDKDPDLNPKKSSNLKSAFEMPEMTDIDKAKYNLGGAKKIKPDDLENYKAMRNKPPPPPGAK